MEKEKLKQMFHLLAGYLMIAHAFTLFENNPKRKFLYIGLYLSAGALFLILAGLHEWLEKKSHNRIDVFIFIVEAAAVALSGVQYYFDGGSKNKLFALGSGFVSVLFLFLAFFYLSEKSRKRRRKSRSSSPGYTRMKDSDM
jgi:ABC-type Mn2+/Zn2+ transport system permease subunit